MWINIFDKFLFHDQISLFRSLNVIVPTRHLNILMSIFRKYLDFLVLIIYFLRLFVFTRFMQLNSAVKILVSVFIFKYTGVHNCIEIQYLGIN